MVVVVVTQASKEPDPLASYAVGSPLLMLASTLHVHVCEIVRSHGISTERLPENGYWWVTPSTVSVTTLFVASPSYPQNPRPIWRQTASTFGEWARTRSLGPSTRTVPAVTAVTPTSATDRGTRRAIAPKMLSM